MEREPSREQHNEDIEEERQKLVAEIDALVNRISRWNGKRGHEWGENANAEGAIAFLTMANALLLEEKGSQKDIERNMRYVGELLGYKIEKDEEAEKGTDH